MSNSTRAAMLKAAIALASVLCIITLTEMSWRVYGLGLAIESQVRFPPMTAEALSTKAAPLLRAATNSDPIYSIVQSQHVELQQKHEFFIAIAQSARATALFGAVCSALILMMLAFSYFVVSRLLASEPAPSPRGTNAA
jgi:hypothetical protein